MNITKTVEKTIESHPSIKDCMKKKLVNYSQLSREIIKETGLKSRDFDAVLIACRRYQEKLKNYTVQEDRIKKLLSKSDIEVKNNISVIVIDKTAYSEDLIELERLAKKRKSAYYAIEGTEVITIVLSSKILPEAKKRFSRAISHITENLALVLMSSAEEIEETIGSFAYLTSLLSYNGINIVETLSCWNETIFVVGEKDIAGVMKVLSF
ncbi:MAG: hypothetical protein EPN86_06305 [Nanoarchaeota archaeon]|nr:MAG: hypothetical protein EPN86_06305 [Nanoarchaeota archaeon]